MTHPDDEKQARRRQRHEASRTVQLYTLLIAALCFINVLIYWEGGSKLSLVVAGIAGIALVGYLLYARRVLRAL